MLPLRKWGLCRSRGLFSQPVSAWEDSSGPLRANQGIFKVEPRDGHAVCTLWVHPPTSPYPFLLKQYLSPEVIAGSDMKFSYRIYPATQFGKGLSKIRRLY